MLVDFNPDKHRIVARFIYPNDTLFSGLFIDCQPDPECDFEPEAEGFAYRVFFIRPDGVSIGRILGTYRSEDKALDAIALKLEDVIEYEFKWLV